MNGLREDPRALIRYALAAGGVTVVLIWVLYQAREALLLLYVSALVAIGLAPLVNAIERRGEAVRGRSHVPRWLAILTIYLWILAAILAIGMLIVPPLAEQARELWRSLPSLLQDAQRWLIDRGVISHEITMREAVEKTPMARTGTDAVTTVFSALWGFVGGIFGLVTILILAFYLMLDADTIVRTFVRLFPVRSRTRAEEACRRVSTKVSAWLAGQMLLAGIIGATAALGLYLMGVPFFYVLALIAAIGELIPIIGPLLAAIPAILIGFTVSPTLGLGVAAFYVLQQQFENHILVPKIMERQVGVSAVVVVIALLIGVSLLGIVGAILAVPTAAILQVVFHELVLDPAEP